MLLLCFDNTGNLLSRHNGKFLLWLYVFISSSVGSKTICFMSSVSLPISTRMIVCSLPLKMWCMRLSSCPLIFMFNICALASDTLQKHATKAIVRPNNLMNVVLSFLHYLKCYMSILYYIHAGSVPKGHVGTPRLYTRRCHLHAPDGGTLPPSFPRWQKTPPSMAKCTVCASSLTSSTAVGSSSSSKLM